MKGVMKTAVRGTWMHLVLIFLPTSQAIYRHSPHAKVIGCRKYLDRDFPPSSKKCKCSVIIPSPPPPPQQQKQQQQQKSSAKAKDMSTTVPGATRRCKAQSPTILLDSKTHDRLFILKRLKPFRRCFMNLYDWA